MRLHTRGLLLTGIMTAGALGLAVPAAAAGAPVAELLTDQPKAAGPDLLFLPNIDDDAGVCRSRARTLVDQAVDREDANDEAFDKKRAELEDEPDRAKAEAEWAELIRTHRWEQNKTDRDLAACNDAADDVVNGSDDEADLSRFRTRAWPEAPASASARVTVPARDADRIRLFVHRPGGSAPRGWEAVGPETRLTAQELRRGVEFGVEGRDVVRDAAGWQGRTSVTLAVTADGTGSSAVLKLRQAPVLTQLNTAPVQEVLRAGTDDGDTYGEAFTKELDAALPAGGVRRPSRVLDTKGDAWAQDIFEPGYVSVPGRDGRPHGMRVLITSVNDDRRVATRTAFTELAGHDVAAVHIGHVPDVDENSSYDSMGNLETVPPSPGNPHGRIVIGGDGTAPGKNGPAPEMLAFLRAQGTQDPVSLDTSWLTVGHVDEFVQFLPAPGSRLGWRAVVADPRAGLALLRDVRKKGHGSDPLHGGLPKLEWPYDGRIDQRSVDAFLGDAQFTGTNERAAERIDANLAVLKAKTGLTDAEIVRVPALYTARSLDYAVLETEIRGMKDGPEKDAKQKQLAAMRDAVAEIPGTVNGLVLNGGHYVAPKPYGPVVDGKDVFAEAITAAFHATGYRVSYVDDLISTHVSEGEIHCATNTLRDVSGPEARWWRKH
ncbi:protein-arginine deiminase domain-containing protein [Streptomyces sp. LP11]|uniref:Protein-arginine deiminase domain-containing protein n=1 Tax=Streptomyces pyxinicus TaxID=2970331 RepID=A0ABT2B0F0_9ACTN|nr:protein-arginine deiminase domain-containing protein [Streptomyces sp. LP11]MCS0601984.1 protein-arginine deiminase domain-containing protein [Streptomyces sp. LP11]